MRTNLDQTKLWEMATYANQAPLESPGRCFNIVIQGWARTGISHSFPDPAKLLVAGVTVTDSLSRCDVRTSSIPPACWKKITSHSQDWISGQVVLRSKLPTFGDQVDTSRIPVPVQSETVATRDDPA